MSWIKNITVFGIIILISFGARIWAENELMEPLENLPTSINIYNESILENITTKYNPLTYLHKGDFTSRARIPAENIHVFSDHIEIDLKGICNDTNWASHTNTDSMIPTFDNGHHTIKCEIHNKSDLQIGDIISYNHFYVNQTIMVIHRIVNIDYDEDGWYAQTKGDNLRFKDSYKVRAKDLIGKTVAIIL